MWGLVMSRGRSVEGHGECPVAEAVAATGRVRTGAVEGREPRRRR